MYKTSVTISGYIIEVKCFFFIRAAIGKPPRTRQVYRHKLEPISKHAPTWTVDSRKRRRWHRASRLPSVPGRHTRRRGWRRGGRGSCRRWLGWSAAAEPGRRAPPPCAAPGTTVLRGDGPTVLRWTNGLKSTSYITFCHILKNAEKITRARIYTSDWNLYLTLRIVIHSAYDYGSPVFW